MVDEDEDELDNEGLNFISKFKNPEIRNCKMPKLSIFKVPKLHKFEARSFQKNETCKNVQHLFLEWSMFDILSFAIRILKMVWDFVFVSSKCNKQMCNVKMNHRLETITNHLRWIRPNAEQRETILFVRAAKIIIVVVFLFLGTTVNRQPPSQRKMQHSKMQNSKSTNSLAVF